MDTETGTELARARSALTWTVVFALFTLARLAFHEMWRDELNPWAGAVESRSLGDMIAHVRSGGHGYLWAALLYFAARLSSAPEALQLLHAAIATAVAWIVLRHAPLHPWLCRLLVFGYGFGFEYAVISRSYSLGALCLAAALVLLTRAPPRVLAGAACLAVAAHTTIYALILALAIGAGWGVGQWRARFAAPGLRTRLVLGAAILLSSALAAAWCMHPPADTGFAVGWQLTPKIDRALATAQIPWRAFFPVPKPGLHFWNSNILARAPWTSALLSVLLLLAVTWHCRRSSAAMTCWIIGAGGVLLFSYAKFMGEQRHHGHLFLAFLAAAWLAGWQARRGRSPAAMPMPGRGATAALWGVLVIQFACCMYASTMDVLFPFSASKEAAAWLRREHLDDRLIIADRDTVATPVLARLERTPFLYARGERTRRMIVWDLARTAPVSEEKLVGLVEDRMKHEAKPPVLLTSYPLRSSYTTLRLAAMFTAGIVKDEAYFVYIARSDDGGTAGGRELGER